MTDPDDDELAAELPDPGILDEYEQIVPGARKRLLAMRRRGGSWDDVGAAFGVVCEDLRRVGLPPAGP